MARRFAIGRVLLFSAIVLLVQIPGTAQSQAKTAPVLRTPDGVPDLQGTWSFATLTPFERPAELAAKEVFTDAEAAAYEKDLIARNNMDRRDGTPEQDVTRAYNNFWWDRGTRVVWTKRTSLVVDPKDGKIPPMTAAGRARQQERQEANRGHEFDGPENRPLPERCLILQGAGPPITPTAYNNNVQIVQSPGYVALLIEMGHEVRMIPTDGRPHLPENVRLWKGDPRGHWDGDTLVVETTNFSDKNPFRGVSSPKMRLIERFRRVDADRLTYQFTIDDAATWERPWTVEIPVTKSEGQVFEYACHEGNYGMTGMLSGARAQERASKKDPQ
jgi:hypothetical protein